MVLLLILTHVLSALICFEDFFHNGRCLTPQCLFSCLAYNLYAHFSWLDRSICDLFTFGIIIEFFCILQIDFLFNNFLSINVIFLRSRLLNFVPYFNFQRFKWVFYESSQIQARFQVIIDQHFSLSYLLRFAFYILSQTKITFPYKFSENFNIFRTTQVLFQVFNSILSLYFENWGIIVARVYENMKQILHRLTPRFGSGIFALNIFNR